MKPTEGKIEIIFDKLPLDTINNVIRIKHKDKSGGLQMKYAKVFYQYNDKINIKGEKNEVRKTYTLDKDTKQCLFRGKKRLPFKVAIRFSEKKFSDGTPQQICCDVTGKKLFMVYPDGGWIDRQFFKIRVDLDKDTVRLIKVSSKTDTLAMRKGNEEEKDNDNNIFIREKELFVGSLRNISDRINLGLQAVPTHFKHLEEAFKALFNDTEPFYGVIPGERKKTDNRETKTR